jgi:transposase
LLYRAIVLPQRPHYYRAIEAATIVTLGEGLFPSDLQQWRQSAMTALSQPEEARASPQETREDRRRIKELERDLRRKEKALAETAALLVLSKTLEALFQEGGDE